VLTTTNKRLLISESCGNLNRCTPCSGNLIHTTRTLFMLVYERHSYASCGIPRTWQSFALSSTELSRATALEKKGTCGITSPARWLTDLRVATQFLSPLSHWSSEGKAKYLVTTSYIYLLGLYLQHVISTPNTCSWGSTHQSLTDTYEGYNLGGVIFPHHSPCSSHPMVLRFPLRVPSSLQLTSSSELNQQQLYIIPTTVEWSPYHSASIESYNYA
jgi:hypothetical protein